PSRPCPSRHLLCCGALPLCALSASAVRILRWLVLFIPEDNRLCLFRHSRQDSLLVIVHRRRHRARASSPPCLRFGGLGGQCSGLGPRLEPSILDRQLYLRSRNSSVLRQYGALVAAETPGRVKTSDAAECPTRRIRAWARHWAEPRASQGRNGS